MNRGNQEPFEDDLNPMGGLGNLADAMLVLAVGIMLALVMNWHISISGGYTTEMDQSSMQEVDSSQLQDAVEGGTSEDSAEYEEKGTVYIDKKTGTMYLVESDEEK
ncbi:MAG: DUF2149 domain-containing protein [Firmicutes bacterium]|nr:DUF2149 domain-containing protein [Bacillota bacterium]